MYRVNIFPTRVYVCHDNHLFIPILVKLAILSQVRYYEASVCNEDVLCVLCGTN